MSEEVEKEALKTEGLICLPNVSAVIMAEQILNQEGFEVKVMPAPAAVMPGCGFCLRFSQADLKQALEIILKRGLSGAEAYIARYAGEVSYLKIESL